jgi:hypothetical protein
LLRGYGHTARDLYLECHEEFKLDVAKRNVFMYFKSLYVCEFVSVIFGYQSLLNVLKWLGLLVVNEQHEPMFARHIEGQGDERKDVFVLHLRLHFANEFVIAMLACELPATSHLLEVVAYLNHN